MIDRIMVANESLWYYKRSGNHITIKAGTAVVINDVRKCGMRCSYEKRCSMTIYRVNNKTFFCAHKFRVPKVNEELVFEGDNYVRD